MSVAGGYLLQNGESITSEAITQPGQEAFLEADARWKEVAQEPASTPLERQEARRFDLALWYARQVILITANPDGQLEKLNEKSPGITGRRRRFEQRVL